MLQFLRSGALPSDPSLLREMYGEAAFYRLHGLRRAIQARSRAVSGFRTGPKIKDRSRVEDRSKLMLYSPRKDTSRPFLVVLRFCEAE